MAYIVECLGHGDGYDFEKMSEWLSSRGYAGFDPEKFDHHQVVFRDNEPVQAIATEVAHPAEEACPSF